MERPYASLEGLEARRHWYIGYPFSPTQHLLVAYYWDVS